jgi:HPt (histidine-containing phosphotransfer) domain-containing protein
MTEPSERFETLRARYARSFATKHKALAAVWQAVESTPDAASARELQLLVHRLAGSAPSYGYAHLGAVARSIDGALSEWHDEPPARRGDAAQVVEALREPMRALLDELLRQASAPPV